MKNKGLLLLLAAMMIETGAESWYNKFSANLGGKILMFGEKKDSDLFIGGSLGANGQFSKWLNCWTLSVYVGKQFQMFGQDFLARFIVESNSNNEEGLKKFKGIFTLKGDLHWCFLTVSGFDLMFGVFAGYSFHPEMGTKMTDGCVYGLTFMVKKGRIMGNVSYNLSSLFQDKQSSGSPKPARTPKVGSDDAS